MIQYCDKWPPLHPRYCSGMTPTEYHEKFVKPYGIPYREEIPKKTVKDLEDPSLSYFDIHMIYDYYTKESENHFLQRVQRFEHILDELYYLELEFKKVKQHYDETIENIKLGMNYRLLSGEMFNPSVPQHVIDTQYSALQYAKSDFEKKRSKLVTELQELDEHMVKYLEWCDVPRSEIERFCRERFHKDVTKPIPHPGALQDPLYHALVTDDINDIIYGQKGG